jgi:hypothetical protein
MTNCTTRHRQIGTQGIQKIVAKFRTEYTLVSQFKLLDYTVRDFN